MRIWDATNRAFAAADTDETDRAPISQFRADMLAAVRGMRVGERKIAALLWPRNVEPFIRAMRLIYIPSDIACTRAQVGAPTYAASDTAGYSNADCQAVDSSNIPDTIRSRLGLPPLN